MNASAALMRQEMDYLEGQIHESVLILKAQNVSDGQARAIVFNVLTSQQMDQADFQAYYQPATLVDAWCAPEDVLLRRAANAYELLQQEPSTYDQALALIGQAREELSKARAGR